MNKEFEYILIFVIFYFFAGLIGWLLKGEVQRLVLVINGIDSGETLERWVFNVLNEQPVLKESNM